MKIPFKSYFNVLKSYSSVIFGTGLGRGISFLTTLILARSLGLAGFGVFSIFFTVFIFVWQFPTILDAIYVRYAKAEDNHERIEYIRTSFCLKGIIVLFLLAFSYPLGSLLAIGVFNRPELLNYMTAAIIGGSFLSLFTSIAGIFQAEEKFHIFAILNVIFYISVFALIVMIKVFNIPFTVSSVVSAYTASAVIIGLLAVVYLFKITKPPFAINISLLLNMTHFGKWLVGNIFVELLAQRLDVLVLARIISYEELGVYSAAVRVAMFAILLTSAATAIFMPKGCESLKSKQHLKRYFRDSLAISSCLTVVITGIIVLAPLLIKLLFGVDYLGSIPAARLLLLDAIFVLLYTPLGIIFYAKGNSRIIFVFTFIRLTLIVLAMLIFIPLMGALGAALSLAVSSFLCLIIVATKALIMLRLPMYKMMQVDTALLAEK